MCRAGMVYALVRHPRACYTIGASHPTTLLQPNGSYTLQFPDGTHATADALIRADDGCVEGPTLWVIHAIDGLPVSVSRRAALA
ncbi:uncharacterized protein BXZ73DRAFT_106438 [Epithele typhae]|uniref:uncharacterized protein n=1 Tax=Epithele typhae TaxID=378194 RepID=UPI002008954C|nr:uncharacterized protein BXZ73DRAFT_106438 [Epithele typhae]KAH9914768.1 hypothetical protein BXZ73DRAFT_106438 [Epithele typhae]